MICMSERFSYLYMVVWMVVWATRIQNRSTNKETRHWKSLSKVIIHRQTSEVQVHWGNRVEKAGQDHDPETLSVAYMVDHEDTSSTRSTSPTPREQKAERKHVERMHSREDSVKRNEQQKREREERYAMHTWQKTTGKEENMNVYEPPVVGSHTTQPIHHRNQSEGGRNDRTYKGYTI